MEEYNTLKSYDKKKKKYFEDTKNGNMQKHYDKDFGYFFIPNHSLHKWLLESIVSLYVKKRFL